MHASEPKEPRVSSMPTLSSSAPASRASVPLSYITAWSDGGGGPEEPPERVAWRQQMERRLRVLEEILETERDFLCDLRVFRKRVFTPLQQLGCASALNGDLDNVIALSARIFSELRHLVITNDTPSQIVGGVFVSVRDEVEVVYKSYCAHHEQGLAEMEMWSHDPHSCDCLQGSITALREIYTHVGKRRLVDVPSFLILPVQRVTRYPLLLSELARHTPPSHPDSEPLARAVASLRDANMAINDAQRLVVRRVPPPPAPLSVLAERLFQRGVSSLAKTTAQIRQLAGLTSRDDDGGEDLAKRFRVLHIDVKTSAATTNAAATATVANDNNNNNNNNRARKEEEVAAASVSSDHLVSSQPGGGADGRHGNPAARRAPLRRCSEEGTAPRSPWRRNEEKSHTDGELDDDDARDGGGRTKAKRAGDARRRARSRPPGPEPEPEAEREAKREPELKPKPEPKPELKAKPKQRTRAQTPGSEAGERAAPLRRRRHAASEEATDSDRTDSVRTGSDSGFDSLSRSRNLPQPPARGPHPPHPPLPLPPPSSPEVPPGRVPRRGRPNGDRAPRGGPARPSEGPREAAPGPPRRPNSSHDVPSPGYDYDYGRAHSDCPAARRDRRDAPPRCPPLHGDPAGPPRGAPDYGTLRPPQHTASAPVFAYHTTDRAPGRRRCRSPTAIDVVDCRRRPPPPLSVHRPPGIRPDRQPPRRDGADIYRTVERGRRRDGHHGDGQRRDGYCDDGDYRERCRDGYRNDGYRREGPRGDGYRGHGTYGDGYRDDETDGDSCHGDRTDGDSYRGIGYRGDRSYGDGYCGDGRRGDGGRGDGHRGDGYQGDSHRGDGRREDGYRGDGYRGDGYRGDGHRGDGYRGDGYRGDGCGSPSSSEGAPARHREHEEPGRPQVVGGGGDGRERMFYQAVYSFSARVPNQLSVRERDRVRVLCFHDEAGNSAWWLAEGPAGRGYLPAAYLRASHYT